MKSYIIGLIAATMLCGCSERILTPSEQAVRRARDLIGTLRTNSSVRAIHGTQAVRSNLVAITDVELRRRTLDEWKKALFDIKVDRLRPSLRYGAISEVADVVTWDVVGAIRKFGGSYEDAWDIYFEVLAWIDGQCRAMKPKEPEIGCDLLEEDKKWMYYGALLEYREGLIENFERFKFESMCHPVDQSRVNAVKARLEKVIGRPVRPSREIKMLGRYAEEVRKHVEKERKEAMQKAEALQREMWKKNPPPLRPTDGRYVM